MCQPLHAWEIFFLFFRNKKYANKLEGIKNILVCDSHDESKGTSVVMKLYVTETICSILFYVFRGYKLGDF